MNLLVLASDVPHRRHGLGGVTAVNIVLYELLTGLLSCGAKLSLQIIFNKWRTVNALSPEETEELKNLESLGVRVLPAIYPHDYLNGRQVPGMVERVGKLARFLSGMVRVSDVYPVTRVRDEMAARLPQISPDAILTIWSPEGVAATYGLKGVTKVAYHGDIEFGPAEARMSNCVLSNTRTKPPLSIMSHRAISLDVSSNKRLAEVFRAIPKVSHPRSRHALAK